MKSLRSLVLVLLATPLFAKGPGKYFDIKDFHCGMDSYHSSLTIDDCYVQDAQNVFFDQDAGIVKRQGFTIFGSSKAYAYSGAWQYTDAGNSTWMIVRASDTIMATKNGTFSVKIATVSSNDIVAETNSLGNAYFVDQTQGVYYWNGTSTTYVSGSPQGSVIANFHGRVWVSGLQVPRGNHLYGSEYLNGGNWTVGTLATSPILVQVGLSDNIDVITTLAVYLDTMYILKTQSIHGLYGFDQTNFQVSILNTEVGCIDPGSMQPYQGGLVFMSQRGLEFFDGYRSNRISQPIKELVDAAGTSTFAQLSWTQDSQADWQSGTINTSDSLNTTASPGNLILSTAAGSFTDDTNAEFNLGALSNVTVQNNSVVLSTDAAEVSNNSFESGTGGGSGWTSSGSGQWSTDSSFTGVNCTISAAKNGTLFADESFSSASGVLHIEVNDAATGSSYGSTTVNFAANSCAWTQRTVTVSASALRKRVVIKIYDDTGPTTLTSDSFISNSRNITIYTASDVGSIIILGSPHTFWEFAMDWVQGTPKSSITSGTFTSTTFDTAVSSQILTGSISISSTSSNEPIATVLQHSTNGSSWADLTTAVGQATVSNRYLRYLSTFTVGSSDNAGSTLNSAAVSYNFTRTSGTFTSQSHSMAGATTFGNFAVDQSLGNGTIAYNVCTSTSSDMKPKVCVITSPNTQISVATNTYVGVIATFTVTNATQTPTLSDFSITWNSGSRRPRMSSLTHDDRYWLALTTSTADDANDCVIVMSKGPVFTRFTQNAGALVNWENAVYHADSRPTGYVYADNLGYNDNGRAIDAYVKTKDFAPDGLISDKFWESAYLIGDNLGAYSIYSTYFLDRSTTTFTLGTASQNETPGTMITRISLPIDLTHQNYSKTISFKLQQNDIDAPMKLYGLSLRYHRREPI